jgi:hypothetical protein
LKKPSQKSAGGVAQGEGPEFKPQWWWGGQGIVKAEKGGLLHSSGHAMGRGRISTQVIFSHLLDTDMSYRFK